MRYPDDEKLTHDAVTVADGAGVGNPYATANAVNDADPRAFPRGGPRAGVNVLLTGAAGLKATFGIFVFSGALGIPVLSGSNEMTVPASGQIALQFECNIGLFPWFVRLISIDAGAEFSASGFSW